MMTNLFSIFDPSTSFFWAKNWITYFLVFLVLSSKFWKISYKFSVMVSIVSRKLHEEFKTILGFSLGKGLTILLITLFFMIVVDNFLGLFPYVFNSTSHMSITLSLAFPLWASLMIFGWVNHSAHMFAHLVPQSTPSALMPFMVLIESISNTIRPMTLAVRLMANMIAGHLLMTLLGSRAVGVSLLMVFLVIISQILLLILELSVSVIQAYVFSVLVTLYTSEVSSN